MTMTHTFGTTPKNEIIAACKGEPYVMYLNGTDAQVVQTAVNQGIDSHLEACFVPDRGDSYAVAGFQGQERLVCVVSPESLSVLMRRLFETDTEDGWSVRSGILETLGLEEV